jgi:hypothetical protein
MFRMTFHVMLVKLNAGNPPGGGSGLVQVARIREIQLVWSSVCVYLAGYSPATINKGRLSILLVYLNAGYKNGSLE